MVPVTDPGATVGGTRTIRDGREDIATVAQELADRLPEPLSPLARLAYNYRWSWQPGGHELFAAIDHERFELSQRNQATRATARRLTLRCL